MGRLSSPLLDLARLETLRRVGLRPRSTVEGTYSGRHASRYRGQSVEFADYRDYAEGDDIRLIDWKVYARSDKHYVKLFEAERSLCSLLLVDGSGSMEYAGTLLPTLSKFDYARRLAAALAYLTVKEGDESGLCLLRDRVDGFLPPRSGWRHLAAMVQTLEGQTPHGTTDLAGCLGSVYKRLSRRGTLVIISDFLDITDEFWKKISLYRNAKFDIILLHLMHPEEIELPEVAVARFTGTEGEAERFDAEPAEIAALYRERFQQHLQVISAGARTRGCAWHPGRCDEDPYLFLKRCFLERENA